MHVFKRQEGGAQGLYHKYYILYTDICCIQSFKNILVEIVLSLILLFLLLDKVSLCMQPRVSSNYQQFSCPRLPQAGITGWNHHSWLWYTNKTDETTQYRGPSVPTTDSEWTKAEEPQIAMEKTSKTLQKEKKSYFL